MTAQQIAERIQQNLGVARPARSSDGFWGGDHATVVTGIATTFAPTFAVLRKAVANGRNLIVTRESPSWNRNPRALAGNATFTAKAEFIQKHGLVIYRLRDQWSARTPDPQLEALAKALGWEQRQSAGASFQLPPATLSALVAGLQKRLGSHGARVLGDPNLKVSKVVLSHGMVSVAELRKMLEAPDIDAVVVGEPVECIRTSPAPIPQHPIP